MNTPIPADPERPRLSWLLVLITVELLTVTGVLLRTTSEEAHSLLWGYSPARLLILALLLILSGLSGASLVVLRRSGRRAAAVQAWLSNAHNRRTAALLALAIGLAAWIGLFLPAYRLGSLAAYVENLYPVLGVGVLISLEVLGFLFMQTDPLLARPGPGMFRKHGSLLLTAAAIAGSFVAIWGLIAVTRLGVDANNEDYWYEAGVPLLGVQVLIALGAGLAIWMFEPGRKRPPFFERPDWILFAAIWLVSGVFWALTPAAPGYFNPEPLPPAHETFPFSDAAKFDMQSQFALIGQGLNNGARLARPVYAAFLTLIHLLTGQNYELNMSLQALVFGVFPALVYLIGAALFHRSAGVAAAVAICLRGLNSLTAASILNVANPKQMLSDFPTALGVSLVLLLGVLWFRSPDRLRLPLLTGGAIAVSLYLRQTAFGYVPVLLLLAVLAYRGLPRKWLLAGVGLLVLGFVCASAAWEVRNGALTGSASYPSSFTKLFSVLSNRYPASEDQGWREQPPGPGQEQPADETDRWNRAEDESWPDVQLLSRLDLGPVSNHILHNAVTSILILPDSLTLHDLRTTVRQPNSYWRATWDGNLSFEQFALLALNLGLLGLGLLLAVRGNPAAGLLPAGVFAGYQLANAFGRSSGGRYIVPVDWIVVLYFMGGLVAGTLWLMHRLGLQQPAGPEVGKAPDPAKMNLRTLVRPALLLLLAGGLLLVPELVFPRAFENGSKRELLMRIDAYTAPELDETTRAYIRQLLEDEGQIVLGKILYPRYAARGASGELFFLNSPNPVEYPLLSFSMIGPRGRQDVRFAGRAADGPQNYSEAIVVGCRRRGLEAVVIVVTAPRLEVYVRDPLPPAECPLALPVCDGAGNCQ